MKPFELDECRSTQPSPKAPQELSSVRLVWLSVQVAYD